MLEIWCQYVRESDTVVEGPEVDIGASGIDSGWGWSRHRRWRS